MEKLTTKLEDYIQVCKTQKCLDLKTIRAYTIDLSQFANYINDSYIEDLLFIMLISSIAHFDLIVFSLMIIKA